MDDGCGWWMVGLGRSLHAFVILCLLKWWFLSWYRHEKVVSLNSPITWLIQQGLEPCQVSRQGFKPCWINLVAGNLTPLFLLCLLVSTGFNGQETVWLMHCITVIHTYINCAYSTCVCTENVCMYVCNSWLYWQCTCIPHDHPDSASESHAIKVFYNYIICSSSSHYNKCVHFVINETSMQPTCMIG